MRIAIIPARGGSKRIKNKNIVEFCGLPLICHALAAVKASGLFDCIHVSTDDDAIATVAANSGFPPEFKRDHALADDFTPLAPVLKWVVGEYDRRGRYFNCVALVMPTAPLIEATDLMAGMEIYDHHAGKSCVLATSSFPAPIEWAFRVNGDGNMTAVQPGMDQVRSQDLPKAYYDSGTFVLMPGTVVRGYPSVKPTYVASIIPRYKAVDIDDHEDLELARALFHGRKADANG